MAAGHVARYVCAVPVALRRLWAWLHSHPLAADVALAAVLFGAALVSLRTTLNLYELGGDPTYHPPSTFEKLCGLAATICPLVLRRRAPLLVLPACTAGFLLARVAFEVPESSMTAIALSLAVYSTAAYGRALWRHVVCSVTLVVIMGELWREVDAQLPPDVPDAGLVLAIELLVNVALFGAMWALGSTIGAGRRRAAELLERTVALEQQREENARRAVFDERVRIARELHDVVAHHVSVMGVQAGAARVVMEREPAKATAALASIEASSRQAVTELHRLLGFLRQAGDTDDMAPLPGVDQLDRLAATLSGSEFTVEVGVEGERRPLPPTVDVSAYRIVQEALTNTLKHADASRAAVHLRYRPGELEVEVTDDGRGSAGSPERARGLGLIGMRERAALHGGELTAGPARGGGFAVRVNLPTLEGAV
jgi:signal transduction histidine kinase